MTKIQPKTKDKYMIRPCKKCGQDNIRSRKWLERLPVLELKIAMGYCEDCHAEAWKEASDTKNYVDKIFTEWIEKNL